MNSTPSRRAIQKQRKARNRRAVVGSVVAIVLLGGSALFYYSYRTNKPQPGPAVVPNSTLGKTATKPAPLNSKTLPSPQSPINSTPSKPVISLPVSKLLSVAPQSQLPQLANGCEVTSLSMLLGAIGHPIDKMTLAREQPKDPTQRVYGPHGVTTFWGNPNVGFVGSVYQYANGFGIYHGPIAKFINQLLPGRAEDLTGHPFSDILSVVAQGTPVILWTTATFQPTNVWTSWNTPEGPVKVTLQEHAVLLVGYNRTELFINNPLNGAQAQAVNRQQFLLAWGQLGNQAVTIRKTPGLS